MSPVVLVGAGKIGQTICHFLNESGSYRVTLVDSDPKRLDHAPDHPGLAKRRIDVTDVDALAQTLADHFAVINAGPFFLTEAVARAAVRSRLHYLDLTEDIASARAVRELARCADKALIPQCGLAPGFVSVVANDIADRFESLDTLSMRVGALPEYPTNSLSYNLTWSTDGVINEYCEPCNVIVNGQATEVQPLEHLEEFHLDGVAYESFNTSGGLGTLGDTLLGKVRNLNYQTIRYPGHCDIMKVLLHDLRLAHRRELLKDVLENAVPTTVQDVVLVFVTASGARDGYFLQESYANKIYSRTVGGRQLSAIQITTAASVCATLDLLREGRIPATGVVRQEQIRLKDFLGNRFGRYFQQEAQRNHT
ncbi:MAG: NAD(P)H-binding protein [Gammaproteobacteria bacterium]|nr:NAD(P)H-binding protein [Gammaproteobacteria bacterium]MYF30949.1 NAD(P)H-binding protein [Gammaproteobacteria bacterium]MYK46400.1 NAD(P)H-binding protein [Gammaproteobacteria bacterium]